MLGQQSLIQDRLYTQYVNWNLPPSTNNAVGASHKTPSAMASSYTMAQTESSNYHRGHHAYPSLNGIHSELSTPETLFTPDNEGTPEHLQAQSENHDHFYSNGSLSNGHLSINSRRLPMKGRVRGESDLGGSRIVSYGTNALSQHKRHITRSARNLH